MALFMVPLLVVERFGTFVFGRPGPRLLPRLLPVQGSIESVRLALRNIEIKARLADLSAARDVARAIATKELGLQEQTDTYFRCPNGRLKLRQIEHAPAQLVWYERPDEEGPAASDYRLVPVANPETLKAALASAYGIWCVVRKRREIYLYENVRIHLDEVEGLGAFLEFEAVLGPEVDDEKGRAQLAELCQRMSVKSSELLAVSYSDLLANE